MKEKKQFKINKKALRIACISASAVLLLSVLTVSVCNAVVIGSAKDYIISFEEAKSLDGIDCIVVLGAGVRPDGSMSAMLYERVLMGAELYLADVSERILLSGDHSREDYNEVGAMKDYMVSRGIDANVVFTDHAGFDTYDTFYRARDVFLAKRVVIVTQHYHLSRAVFIARELGLDAYGVACDTGEYTIKKMNYVRETAARTKYVFDALFMPEPKFLGETIPIWGEASASDG